MKIVCIIGMGRSGTSLLAQILMRLGVYFGEPDELIGVTPNNARGQFEHKAISDILQGALVANGIDWWLTEKTIPSSWYSSESACEAGNAIQDYLIDLTRRAPADFVGFKDSRATLLLPLVNSVLARRIPHVYLRCLRYPRAVASSVIRALPPGVVLTQRECFSIWANYYTAIRALPKDIENRLSNVLDVWYEDWFTLPGAQLQRVCKHLGIPIDAELQARADEALDVIDPELRHHG